MIQQALHGYAHGHDLLAASLKLSREQRIHLAQMTDLSGPSPIRGFDGYLSGFPLPGRVYVLAKTWFATELPRPGCVWTHSLLLLPEDLEQHNLTSLAALFRRPQSSSDFGEYAQELEVTRHDAGDSFVGPGATAPLISRLYSRPSDHVCVLSESAADLESLFLAVWNQQWPSLRQVFSFTTGLLGGTSRPFDLQGIPSKNQRVFQHADGFSIVDRTSITEADGWVVDAGVDASRPDVDSALRDFLWSFGKDFHDGRAAFRGLCETFRVLSVSDAASRAVEAYNCLAEFFVGSTEAPRLKAALFGGHGTRWSIDELDAIEVVARDGLGGVIEESFEHLHMRCEALPLSDLERLIYRLQSARGSQRVETIADVFFERCRGQHVARMPIEMAIDALRRRPKLAQDVAMWERPEAESVALVEAMLSTNVFNGQVARGLLKNGNLRLLYAARQAAPSTWVEAIREYTDERQPDERLEEFVLDRLWNSQSIVKAQLSLKKFDAFLKYASVVLEVSVDEATRFPIEHAELASPLPHLHDAGAEIQACGFLVMLALVRRELKAAQVMAEGFASVYAAVKTEKLPYELWRKLESQLPWHFLDWDRTSRLVEGTVNCFVERDWPADAFLSTFSTEDAFDRALSILESDRRQDFLRRLRAQASSSSGSIPLFQTRRLARALG